MNICEYGCDSVGKHQFKNGKWCCSKSPNSCVGKKQRDSDLKKGKPIWEDRPHPRGFLGKSNGRKGRTNVELFGEDQAKEISKKLAEAGKHDGRARWRKLSKAKQNAIREKFLCNKAPGGYKEGCGHGIKGRFNGIWCDSSWELAFLLYCIDFGLEINRNMDTFAYIFQEKTYNYTPDFIVEGYVFEIKGVWTQKDKAKVFQCPIDINIIDANSIDPILTHVKRIHGPNFTRLYEEDNS